MLEPQALPEFGHPARSLAAHSLLACVLILTVAGPIMAAWHGAPIGVESLGAFNLFGGQALLVLFLTAWFILQDRATFRAYIHLPAGAWSKRLARGLAVGVVGWITTLFAMAVIAPLAAALGVQPQEGFTDIIVWMATRPFGLRIALIAIAMIVEEAFFRAFLQPRLGLLPATLFFALSHMNYGSPIMGCGVFVIGLVLGLAFRKHDDLAICAIAHATFDAIQLLIVLPLAAQHL